MTAKEKAIELVDKYDETLIYLPRFVAEQCAVIAVNEILGYMGADRGTEFWQEVKIEIEKL